MSFKIGDKVAFYFTAYLKLGLDSNSIIEVPEEITIARREVGIIRDIHEDLVEIKFGKSHEELDIVHLKQCRLLVKKCKSKKIPTFNVGVSKSYEAKLVFQYVINKLSKRKCIACDNDGQMINKYFVVPIPYFIENTYYTCQEHHNDFFDYYDIKNKSINHFKLKYKKDIL